jgi:hypothetical protein
MGYSGVLVLWELCKGKRLLFLAYPSFLGIAYSLTLSPQLIFSQVMLLTPGQLLAKASILLLFKQLFTVDKKLNIAIWIGQIFNVLTYLPAIPIEVVFNAPDVGQKWAELMLSGKPQRAIYWGVVQSAMSIVLDLYIFFLPMPTIVKLNMSFRKRAQVVAVFSTALM